MENSPIFSSEFDPETGRNQTQSDTVELIFRDTIRSPLGAPSKPGEIPQNPYGLTQFEQINLTKEQE